LVILYRYQVAIMKTVPSLSSRPWFSLALTFLIGIFAFGNTALAAQDQPGRVQRITGRLEPGENHAYLIRGLEPGDRLTISLRATSGNLDPTTGVMDTARPLAEVDAAYRADSRRLAAESENIALDLEALRRRYFLAWDDDGGEGYAAALEYTIPAAGNYRVIAGASLSTLGRATSGDYELLIGLNAPGATEPVGEPFAEQEFLGTSFTPSVEEITGSLTASNPLSTLRLADMEAGETLYVAVDPVAGNLIPILILRDFGGKPLQAANLDGQNPRAALEFTMPERATGYTLDIQAATGADGAMTAGDFRALLGLNAPEALTGVAAETGDPVLKAPIDVQVGIRIERISEVDSQGEDFTVLGSMRMDWTDPTLAYSPDSCNCAVKIYTEKEFDRFLADVNSRWPDFVFFNQQGNRWVQSRAAAIWPDGRARYGESFTTTFQADFDFRKFPFDNQYFPIYLDLLFPADTYIASELPGFSGISGEHGEDEFIIEEFTTASEIVPGRVTDLPVSRFSFAFNAPRHLDYYTLQVFVPILLIILISWFTFFLRDYNRRIEVSAGNTLLFIAFSFSLADNYPRLGYITFLDAVMGVTFAFNTLVLLYNVYMKRLENDERLERVAHIDHFFDWAYPFLYLGLIGVVALWFLWIG
jgi:hypothetical protein